MLVFFFACLCLFLFSFPSSMGGRVTKMGPMSEGLIHIRTVCPSRPTGYQHAGSRCCSGKEGGKTLLVARAKTSVAEGF